MQIKNLDGDVLKEVEGETLVRCDLPKADLFGAYLSEADLAGANLTEANFREANLSGATLRGANLSFTCVFGFYAGKHFGYAWKKEKEIVVRIGCFEYSLSEWIENYEKIGKKNDYSEEEIKRYGTLFNWIKDNF